MWLLGLDTQLGLSFDLDEGEDASAAGKSPITGESFPARSASILLPDLEIKLAPSSPVTQASLDIREDDLLHMAAGEGVPSTRFLAEDRATEKEVEDEEEGSRGVLEPLRRAWLRVILRSEVAMNP